MSDADDDDGAGTCEPDGLWSDVCYLYLSAHTETERVLPQWLTGIIAVSIFLFLVFVTFLVNRAWCGKSSRSVRCSNVVALHQLKTKCSNKCLCVCVQQGDCRRVPDRRPADVIHWAGNTQVALRLRSSPSQTCHTRKPAPIKHSMSAIDRNELCHAESLLLYKGVQQLTLFLSNRDEEKNAYENLAIDVTEEKATAMWHPAHVPLAWDKAIFQGFTDVSLVRGNMTDYTSAHHLQMLITNYIQSQEKSRATVCSSEDSSDQSESLSVFWLSASVRV